MGGGRISRGGSAGVLPGASRVEAGGGGNKTDLSEQDCEYVPSSDLAGVGEGLAEVRPRGRLP